MNTNKPTRILHILSIDRPGDPPEAVCMSWRDEDIEGIEDIDCRDEAAVRSWKPDNDRLHILFGGERTLACFLSLGWPFPRHLIDLQVESRNMINRRGGTPGKLEECMERLSQPPPGYETRYDPERGPIIDLMERAMHHVLVLMMSYPDIRQFLEEDPRRMQEALLRGEYIKSVALMRHRGIPVDVPLLNALQDGREQIIRTLIGQCEQKSGYGLDINRGPDRQWVEALDREKRRIDPSWPGWPANDGGQLLLNEQAFDQMARQYPDLKDLHQLHRALARIRNVHLPVGSDNRHRATIAPFSTVTGRNKPSPKESLFQQSRWMRRILCPPHGHGLVCIDWSQQEFGICAALSRDAAMIEAYISGDPYLEFARRAGAIPEDGDAVSHPVKRALYKEATLAIQYGMGKKALSCKTGVSIEDAGSLLETHRALYPAYWDWRDRIINEARLYGEITSILGWRRLINRDDPNTSIANFPVQACGAAMMQMASILAMDKGIGVCCPIHDAFLIESPIERIEEEVDRMTGCMNRASSMLLDGLELMVTSQHITPQQRYETGDGELWDAIVEAIGWTGNAIEEGDAV